MIANLTPEKVKLFAERLRQHYGSTYVRKGDAALMVMIGRFLEAIHIQDAETFKRFTTTIEKTIYTPFEIGVPDDRYSLWWQVLVLIHEHVHVMQYVAGGWIDFSAGYLIDRLELVRFEANAYASTFDLQWWQNRTLPDLDAHMEPLSYYGCTPDEVQTAKALAHQQASTVFLGGHTSDVARVAIGLLEEIMPEIREAA